MNSLAISSTVCASALPFLSESRAGNGSGLITISNEEHEVGLLPDFGGRLVLWRHRGGPNLLDAVPGEWDTRPAGWPNPKPTLPWDPGRGHTVWAGPQATWWTDQDVEPKFRASASLWPPDPILTAAPYRVVEQASDRMVLESEPSPYVGLSFRKTIELLPDRVRIHVEATNVRDRPVTRNLWFNFRAPASGRDFVPVSAHLGARLQDSARSQWRGKFHTLEITPDGQRAKAYLDPDTGLIACEVADGTIVIRFEVESPDRVPPGHAPVEIFRGRSAGQPDLLELEHHGPLVTIPPGESIEREETWEFIPGGKPDDL